MTVKDSVLKALENNREDYLSGEKLSDSFGVSRAAVWKAIKALRQEGYRIDAVTNRGYRLAGEGEEFTEDDIRRSLPPAYKGNGIHVYDILDSTNIKARELSADAAAHGTIVIARQQTAGRGRLGRSFYSPEEGLYMSLVIKPRFDMSRSILVTVAAAAAVAEAIDRICGQAEETKIKWVNDVYLEDRKICGILTEGITDFESGQIESLIIGIGINTSLKGFPDELKESAGAVEGDWSRAELIAGIAERTLGYVDEIESRSFMDTYRNKSMLIGKEIDIYRGTYRKDPAKELGGIKASAVGIDEDGGLIVEYEDGSRETLTSGEVSVRTR